MTVPSPTNSTDATTKLYVDNQVAATNTYNRQSAAISSNVTGGVNAKTDYIYYWTGTTAYNFTLPDATIVGLNKYSLKNKSSINQVFATSVSQTVDGSTNGTIVPNQSLEFYSDGSNWYII